jgi:hypothetical protein
LTLPACRQTTVGPLGAGEDACEVAYVDRTLGIGGHGLDHARSQSQQTQSPVDGGVTLTVGDHPHPRRAREPVSLDVPAPLGEDVMAGGGEADGVGALTAGHEAERGSGW